MVYDHLPCCLGLTNESKSITLTTFKIPPTTVINFYSFILLLLIFVRPVNYAGIEMVLVPMILRDNHWVLEAYHLQPPVRLLSSVTSFNPYITIPHFSYPLCRRPPHTHLLLGNWLTKSDVLLLAP